MLRRRLPFLLCAALSSALLPFSSTAEAALRHAPPRARGVPYAFLLGLPLSETSWLLSGSLPGAQPYRLAAEPLRAAFERYLEPSRTRTPEWQAFYRGSYGPPRRAWLPELCWAGTCEERFNSGAPEEPVLAFAGLQFSSAESYAPTVSWFASGREPLSWKPEALAVVRERPCPRARIPQLVRVVRYAGEVERLQLTDCDGAIASEALERLSVLARPPRAPRPELPLPLHPEGELGEWTPEVRLLHPRLAWLVTEIARAFPQRSVVLMSGYRRDAHSGFHQKGQALDLYVQGVPNEDLFHFCRTLPDAGCGYYPNHPFVHVDVRAFGQGHVTWVDTSAPGEPSVYVDGWPGVLPPGVAWLGNSSH